MTHKLISVVSLLLACTLAASAGERPRPGQRAPSAVSQREVRRARPSRLPGSYKELKYPALRIAAPDPARFELANGIVVYLVEDHELPLVTVAALIRAGSLWEPREKAGVAAITGAVIRTGGSASRSGDALDDELDRLGASVEMSVAEDSGTATVSVLKEDADRGLEILSDLLQHPSLPDDKIELEKIQQREAVARRNDDPSAVAARELRRIVYGAGSAYAHQPEYRTLDAIRREDLVAFHRQFFQPENVVLGAWGDFDAGAMRVKIERAFGGWARGGRPRPVAPDVDPGSRSRAGLHLAAREGANQSWVMMGQLASRRDDPDYYALEVMNSVLGAGQVSRLRKSIRSDQGLSFEPGSEWGAGWDHPGIFKVTAQTKSETTVRLVEAIRREIETLARHGATDDEIARAKDSILKGFAFEFESTSKIIHRVMWYELVGYPRDYLQRYRANVERVTREDVARVARERLESEQFTILVLGNEKHFDRPLTSLGPVAPVDVAIPTAVE
jgi:zinc protease